MADESEQQRLQKAYTRLRSMEVIQKKHTMLLWLLPELSVLSSRSMLGPNPIGSDRCGVPGIQVSR